MIIRQKPQLLFKIAARNDIKHLSEFDGSYTFCKFVCEIPMWDVDVEETTTC
jgi:hypothetical protein